MRIAEIFASFGKSGSRNTMVTSDFRPKVKIQPFRACAMKNTQYNPYLWPNRRNFRVFQEIEVEEHHPVSVTNLPEAIQFCSQDALRMHYRQITYEVTLISSDRYKNSSVIVDLAMGQIPRSCLLYTSPSPRDS